jgi:hypothetical protein
MASFHERVAARMPHSVCRLAPRPRSAGLRLHDVRSHERKRHGKAASQPGPNEAQTRWHSAQLLLPPWSRATSGGPDPPADRAGEARSTMHLLANVRLEFERKSLGCMPAQVWALKVTRLQCHSLRTFSSPAAGSGIERWVVRHGCGRNLVTKRTAALALYLPRLIRKTGVLFISTVPGTLQVERATEIVNLLTNHPSH